MFTGIVEEIGIVKSLTHLKNLSAIEIKAKKILKGTKLGDSIAIDGVCLTVIDIARDVFSFDLMKETLSATTLGSVKKDSKVNLERALRANGRFDGHFVTGHVDQVSAIKKIIAKKNLIELQIGLTKGLAKYFVPKGSVCVDGVSLTVGEVAKDYFSVYLIPFTKKVTTLGHKKVGDKVNVETDVLAKYILNS